MIKSIWSLISLIFASNIWKISAVSSKLKYIGDEITRDPFKKRKKFKNFIFLLNPNTLSSLPKWKEATKRKTIKVIAGSKYQSTTTTRAKIIYDR